MRDADVPLSSLCAFAALREIFVCMTQEAAFGPLQGVKVLELGRVMAGPVCGMMLADMGAEVIKLEKIAGGILGGEVHRF